MLHRLVRAEERAAEEKIQELGAKPAFKGYYDYPCVLCTSVNNEIIHGIPSAKRVLKEGDIVSIDCGVVLDGYYSDSAVTVPVGRELAPQLKKLLDVTEASLKKAGGQALAAPAPASAKVYGDRLGRRCDHHAR